MWLQLKSTTCGDLLTKYTLMKPKFDANCWSRYLINSSRALLAILRSVVSTTSNVKYYTSKPLSLGSSKTLLKSANVIYWLPRFRSFLCSFWNQSQTFTDNCLVLLLRATHTNRPILSTYGYGLVIFGLLSIREDN